MKKCFLILIALASLSFSTVKCNGNEIGEVIFTGLAGVVVIGSTGYAINQVYRWYYSNPNNSEPNKSLDQIAENNSEKSLQESLNNSSTPSEEVANIINESITTKELEIRAHNNVQELLHNFPNTTGETTDKIEQPTNIQKNNTQLIQDIFTNVGKGLSDALKRQNSRKLLKEFS